MKMFLVLDWVLCSFSNFLHADSSVELRATSWSPDITASVIVAAIRAFPVSLVSVTTPLTPDGAAGAHFCRFKTDFPPLSGGREQEEEQSVTKRKEGGGHPHVWGSLPACERIRGVLAVLGGSPGRHGGARARASSRKWCHPSALRGLEETRVLFDFTNISTEDISVDQVVKGGSDRR